MSLDKVIREKRITAQELMQKLGLKGKLLVFHVPNKGQPKEMSERILLFKVEDVEEDEQEKSNNRRIVNKSPKRTAKK